MNVRRQWIWIALIVVWTVFLAGCNATTPPDEPPVESGPVALDIVADNAAGYTIVVSDRASSEVTEMALELRSAIEAVTGVKLELTDDFVEKDGEPFAREIIIGLTQREESIQALRETPYGEYSICVVGEKIVIAGWDESALNLACVRLTEHVEENGAAGQYSLMSDYALSGKTFAGLSELPLYGDVKAKIQFFDIGDSSRMLYVRNTTAEEFNTFLDRMSEAGLNKFASREAGKNLFATFTSEKSVINASFNASTREARITVDKAYDMTIFTEQKYEKICEPAVHLLGLEFSAPSEPDNYVLNALGLIFRLEDGRFIIVDGNYYGNKQAKLLYEALCDLAVDKDNIVIAAWVFTHAHSDHVGAFSTFAGSDMKDKVTIENFLYHSASDKQYKALGTFGALSDMRSAMNKYPAANKIKVQAGQVLRAGGAEVEILSTFAEMEPATLKDFNVTSIVLRFNLGGNTVLVPGDAPDGPCNAILRRYGNYLKSDIVQITHHGYDGVAEFYKAVDADVILFPVAARQFYGRGELYRIMDWAHNKAALDLARECYVAAATGHTLILPHTPEDNKTVKIYDGE
jgi:hypothetical protein